MHPPLASGHGRRQREACTGTQRHAREYMHSPLRVRAMQALLARVETRQHAEAARAGQQLAAYCDTQAAAAQSSAALAQRQADTRVVNIELLFYRPREDDFLINRAVSFATRQHQTLPSGERATFAYAHVEICFTYDPHTLRALHELNYSFSIVQGGTVSMRSRTNWRKEYVAVAVPISGEQYRQLYYRCQLLATAEPPIGFDKMGMYLAPVLPAGVLRKRRDETHGTFCSKIIVRALQEARIAEPELAGLEPCCVTPSMLYVRLSKYFVPTQRLGTQL